MNSEIIIYQNPDGNIKIDVRLEEETVWLTQSQLCELFNRSKATISEHIKNVFEEGELDEKVVVRKFRTTTQHGAIVGKTQEIEVNGYNLDLIISVGYRVKSPQGTQFRIWATQRLKEYIIKGFALNDDRFKSGNSMNYFNELQERIREIRISERFFYQKIKDIYTNSIDYDAILDFKKVYTVKTNKIKTLVEKIEQITWINNVGNDSFKSINDLISSIRDLHSALLRQYISLNFIRRNGIAKEEIKIFKDSINDLKDVVADLDSRFFFQPNTPDFQETTKELSLF